MKWLGNLSCTRLRRLLKSLCHRWSIAAIITDHISVMIFPLQRYSVRLIVETGGSELFNTLPKCTQITLYHPENTILLLTPENSLCWLYSLIKYTPVSRISVFCCDISIGSVRSHLASTSQYLFHVQSMPTAVTTMAFSPFVVYYPE